VTVLEPSGEDPIPTASPSLTTTAPSAGLGLVYPIANLARDRARSICGIDCNNSLSEVQKEQA
jgi:hypothetical protein